MLNNCFKAPRSLARLRCGPAKPYLDDFITWLESRGYRYSTIRHHVREVVQFTNLIEAEGLPIRDLGRIMLARLCRDLAEPSSLQYPSGSPRKINHSARLFVNFLCVDGDVALCSSNASTKGPTLLLEFREWMRTQRGTMDTTLNTYRLPIIDLLNDLGTDPSTFDAHGLRK
jgi:integrase/recombinase XerD